MCALDTWQKLQKLHNNWWSPWYNVCKLFIFCDIWTFFINVIKMCSCQSKMAAAQSCHGRNCCYGAFYWVSPLGLLYSLVWVSRAGHSNTINLYVCRGGALWLAYHRTQTQSATQWEFVFNPSTDIDSYYSYDTRTRQKCFIRTGYSFQPSIRLNSSFYRVVHIIGWPSSMVLLYWKIFWQKHKSPMLYAIN